MMDVKYMFKKLNIKKWRLYVITVLYETVRSQILKSKRLLCDSQRKLKSLM